MCLTIDASSSHELTGTWGLGNRTRGKRTHVESVSHRATGRLFCRHRRNSPVAPPLSGSSVAALISLQTRLVTCTILATAPWGHGGEHGEEEAEWFLQAGGASQEGAQAERSGGLVRLPVRRPPRHDVPRRPRPPSGSPRPSAPHCGTATRLRCLGDACRCADVGVAAAAAR
jgi:hypothetical protein